MKSSGLRTPIDTIDYTKKWEYFTLTDTIVVKIIDHVPASVSCGVLATTSVTIVLREEGDTIRILDMCNLSDNYKKGQIIKVAPEQKPPFGLDLPIPLIDPKTGRYVSFVFDALVRKTTWGSLIDN